MRGRKSLIVAIAVMSMFASAAGAQQGYYVLDGFGGVHAGGSAPVVVPATPYFGFDVAVDIEYIPASQTAGGAPGILVLDNGGGVHKGGALAADPPTPDTPYFGFDIARAVTARDRTPAIFSASIQSDGTLVGGATEGVVSATREAAGVYLVTFDRDVSNCHWVAGASAPANIGWDGFPGDSAWISSAMAESFMGIRVVTVGISGQGSVVRVDKNFHIIVTCPQP